MGCRVSLPTMASCLADMARCRCRQSLDPLFDMGTEVVDMFVLVSVGVGVGGKLDGGEEENGRGAFREEGIEGPGPRTYTYLLSHRVLLVVHFEPFHPETLRTGELDRWWDLNGWTKETLPAAGYAHHIRCW